MNAQLFILRLAALLAPREQRDEWSAEWRAELWYVCQAHKHPTAFCLGAFKDAFWLRRNSPPSPPILRLESPLACLLFLTGLSVISVLATLHFDRGETFRKSRYPDSRNLVLISHARQPAATYPTVRIADYQSWKSGRQRLFTSLAFYQRLTVSMCVPGHRTAELVIARATDNLFQVLDVPVPGNEPGVRLILSEAAWQAFFDRDPHLVSSVVEIAGQQALVAGVIPGSFWSLPGRMDAWLLIDRQRLAVLPPDARGFVVARTKRSWLRRVSVPNDGGGQETFDCIPLADRGYGPATGFLIIVMMSGLLLPAITSVSLGEYPTIRDLRRWMFLVAKFALILMMVYCGARDVAYHGRPVHGLLFGCILAFRWVLADQRRRCPVCLRRLTNPVRIGRPSHTFLEWYGTELMCKRGHGFLLVTEIPTSCYSTQRWTGLDGSWSSLFSRS